MFEKVLITSLNLFLSCTILTCLQPEISKRQIILRGYVTKRFYAAGETIVVLRTYFLKERNK